MSDSDTSKLQWRGNWPPPNYKGLWRATAGQFSGQLLFTRSYPGMEVSDWQSAVCGFVEDGQGTDNPNVYLALEERFKNWQKSRDDMIKKEKEKDPNGTNAEENGHTVQHTDTKNTPSSGATVGNKK
jgi:hypothetical protein